MRSLIARLGLLALAAAPSAAFAQASPSPFTTGYRYDAMHRVTGTIEPEAVGVGTGFMAVRNSYDAAGRLVRVEKGQLAAWQPDTVAPSAWTGFTVDQWVDTSWDALDRKVLDKLSGNGSYGSGQPSGLQTVTQTSYDALGRPECVAVRMNPAAYGSLPASPCSLGAEGGFGPDRVTRNVWDAAGQLLKVQKAVGTALQQDYATYEYTPDGKQSAVIDANGNRAEMRYDGHDRQARWVFPSPTSVGQANPADYEEYGYDPNGNRTSLRKRDGSVLAYAYDALDRLVQKAVPASASGAAGYGVFTGYDNRNLELYARFGSDAGPGISNAYDNAGRLTSSTSSMGGASRTIAHQYDADGNRTQLLHPDGVAVTYLYDGLDRLNTLREGADYTDINQLTLRAWYDDLGRLYGHVRGAGSYGFTTLHYWDGASRLTALAHYLPSAADTVGFSLAYNPASQIVSLTTGNDVYVSTSAYNVSRAYSVNGLNQYTAAGPAAFAYDANGNLASDGASTFVYDAENRLVAASGAKNATLAYDPLGRLFQTSGGAAGTTQFLYDGDALVLEYGAAGNILKRYFHGSGEDDPVAQYDGPNIGFANRSYMLPNHQGSIAGLINADGTPRAANGYDAWGIPNAGNQGRFGYTGQAWLPELGMWYYKARIYSPTLGRFLQTDPVGYKDQNNLYAYVGNDPVDGRDTTGLLDDRKVIYDMNTGKTTVIIPYRLSGSGGTAAADSQLQKDAGEIHAPAGESPISMKLVRDASGTGDTQTLDLSPGKDYSINSAGEGNQLAQRNIHIDSSRADAVAAGLHDLGHGGRGGQQGAQDQYRVTKWDPQGHPIASVPKPGYENNIMGTTAGRELSNAQVRNEIAPQSTVIVIPRIPPF